ncbi:MAG: S-adenosylmethionine decarboxylase [Patescibacteria group bacterium]
MKTKRFHYLFDIDNCNHNINDPETIKKFIIELVKKIDMNVLKGPYIAKGIEENPGWSAIVIIDFSNISVHTFTKYKEVLIDVFSCRIYDKDRAFKVCKDFFATAKSKIRKKKVWWDV